METYVEGMLDRDQRTAKLRFFRDDIHTQPTTGPCHEPQESVDGVEVRLKCCRPTRTRRSSGKSSHLACRNGYLLNTFQSVKNVLLVVCITLVTVPLVSCYPVDKMSLKELENSPKKWVNACETPIEVGALSDFNKKELGVIRSTASQTLDKANNTSTIYTTETFQKPMKEVHQDLVNQHPQWLQMKLPKELNGSVPDGHFENLKVETVLLDMYSLLQRMAVGLEQITHSQNKSDGRFVDDFESREFELKSLLCELLHSLKAHGHPVPPDVEREIMPAEERDGDSGFTKNRDFMILRDYLTALEYTVAALDHYMNVAQS